MAPHLNAMCPLLSIVIANYNFGRFLGEAIGSVVAQIGEGPDQVRPGEVELIVIDGGSTDGSVQVIRAAADKLAYWVSEPDRGQSDAFNKGFAKAKGRFLTWLNADDVMLPGTLAKLRAAAAAHPACEWFVGGVFWLDPEMRIVHCGRGRPFSEIRARAGHVCVWGPSSFFTRRLLDAAGGVDVRFSYMMDADLWLKFAQAGARYRPFCAYAWGLRLHPDSKMSQNNFSASGKLRLRQFAPWNDRQRRAEEQKAREIAWMRERAPVRPLGRLERAASASWLEVLAAQADFWRYRGKHYLTCFKGVV